MSVQRTGASARFLGARGSAPDERGVNQSTSLALVTPLVLATFLGVLQAGLWLHATTVATRAAQAGADTARSVHGSEGQAIGVATRIAQSNGLDAIEVGTQHDTVQVTVTVRADAPLLLVPHTVTASATAPRERVTTP